MVEISGTGWIGLLGIFVLVAVCGYLLGSINSAIVICRLMFKKDIRKLGSGNAGMTNVMRCFGKKSAVLTLLGDVTKGILSVMIGRLVITLLAPGLPADYGAYIGAIFAVAGHMLPIYFGFKGGKGVAAAGGAIIALNPIIAAVLLAVLLIVIAVGKMVSLGSIIGIAFYPITTFLWYSRVTSDSSVFPTICTAVIAVLIIWMHRENIKRIAAGKENKIGSR